MSAVKGFLAGGFTVFVFFIIVLTGFALDSDIEYTNDSGIAHTNELNHTDRAVLIKLAQNCYGRDTDCYVKNLGYGLDNNDKYIIESWTNTCQTFSKYQYDRCWSIDSEDAGIITSIRNMHLKAEK